MLLVLTNKLDAHADHLITKVAGRFPVFRINSDDFLEDYAFSLSVSADGQLSGRIADSFGHGFDFADRAVGWFRKPVFEAMRVGADAEYAALVRSETESFAEALCALPNISWLNRRPAVMASRTKPAQLLLARELGFAVPETLITNTPEDAVRFAGRVEGGTIVKSIYSASVRFGEHDFSCITHRIDGAALAESQESIAVCPTQLQEEIAKLYDLRVTVVGDDVFACRIDSQANAATEVDWRAHPELCGYSALDLPDGVARACRELVRRSGLEYGAIDLILSRDGEYVFLENNPTGQYLWMELGAGLEITSSLIRLIERKLDHCPAGLLPDCPKSFSPPPGPGD